MINANNSAFSCLAIGAATSSHRPMTSPRAHLVSDRLEFQAGSPADTRVRLKIERMLFIKVTRKRKKRYSIALGDQKIGLPVLPCHFGSYRILALGFPFRHKRPV